MQWGTSFLFLKALVVAVINENMAFMDCCFFKNTMQSTINKLFIDRDPLNYVRWRFKKASSGNNRCK